MKHIDRNFVIENASVVTPYGILERSFLKIEDGIISEIKKEGIKSKGKRVDASGKFVLPGFIDLHSDAIEKEIEPRPNSYFPPNIAIFELDKKLAACGVTTIFHAVSFAEGEIGIRSNKMAAQLINEITRLLPELNVKTKIHARLEITDAGAVPYLEKLLKNRKIHLLSLMDHTPGQGQFKEVTAFKNYYGRVYNKSDAELDEIIDRKLETRKQMKTDLDHLISLGQTLEVPIASHDDDSVEKIKWLEEKKIKLIEFPVNMETVRAARAKKMWVCLGAPNVLMGTSQAKNLSAREAVSLGYGDIFCSDYTPMALLHAVFTLDKLGILPLQEAVNMVSLNPARAVGISEHTGSIEPGKEADLFVVDPGSEVSRIEKTFVLGREVYSTC